jgi:ABC-type amino acid transport substrate-binding protein
MAPPRHLFLILVAAAAAFLCTTVPAVAAAQGYCRDSLAGLKECESFMYGGAAAPSATCCAAYEAAFDADPFCLCYVADGTYGRATGYDVDVTHGLQIPARCGQAQPPIELCNSK